MKRSALTRALGLASLLLGSLAAPAQAAWMWDQDGDRIDDRIEQVEASGPLAARVGGLASGRLRFALMNATAPFEYGVYVGYDHHPTDADAAALAALGVPVQVRYRAIDYIRTRVTLAQAMAIAALPGVTRIETIPILYPVNDVATQALRARGSGSAYFPSVWTHLGVTGRGVTVAILDTGVNDEADATTGYPGHESLRGKWVGGGSFFAGDPLLNTPIDQSVNPRHTLDPEATYHGTHVAGTAIGSGGPEGTAASPGFFAGLAPDARLVDMKVLSDAGAGFGSADAIDWLIAHRNDSWGLTGADSVYRGVDVANLSLGGTDASDGTDANSAAVNAAVRADIVVCVASGNDGNTAFMVAPGAADLALTVGSFTDYNTVPRGDDVVADYSNEGPRLDDGDADHEDEMKPNVLGSGTGILSALGDPTTDGRQYHHINGTSMACPSVAGVAALVRSANPGLSAAQVHRLLMDTADHRRDHGKQPPSAADPFGVDPNYHPSWGWGQVDAFAAVKEAQNALTTQVTRFEVTPVRGPDGFEVTWTAQREIGLGRWFVERAPDVAGGPGPWTAVHMVTPSSPRVRLQREENRTSYTFVDLDPSLVADVPTWYRVRWTHLNEAAPDSLYGSGSSASFGHPEPALSARIADSPVVARVRYSWTHDYSDGDLALRFGTGTSTTVPVWDRPGRGAPAADSVVVRLGDPFTGTLQHYFHVDLTADDLVSSYLPPSAANPWFLSVKEGGYLNTKGRVNDFSITWFGPGGAVTHAAPNPVTETIEKQETVFWIPLPPATSLNHAPVIAAIAPQRVGEGLARSFAVNATDADGDALTYSALDLPAGATFDPGTRMFAWTPNHAQAGAYTVRFVARDAAFPVAAADTEHVAITVVDRVPGENTAPLFDPQSDRAAFVGEPVRFRVTARDPDETAPAYALTGSPAGASVDPVSGLFAWTANQLGTTRFTFTATDPGGLADTVTVNVVATDLEDGPAPPVTCSESVQSMAGVVGEGNTMTTSETIVPFVALPGVQRIEGLLTWFGGPVVDLDLYLLDGDGNVVASAASIEPSERLVYNTPQAGVYRWRVVGYANPDTAQFTIDVAQCASEPLVDAETRVPGVSFAPAAPNPFTTTTRIAFALPARERVQLRLFNVAGRLVRTLENGELEAGTHVRLWDRRTDAGTLATSGIYFARLVAGSRVLGQKIVLTH
jgi:subtilisin family serine protease